jgi:uncharacterized membrane protein HdeD (DUF308 family)
MATLPAANALASKWWVLLFRGILAVLFGIAAFALPGLTLVTLVLLYGVYALADGLTALWVGGSARAWSLALLGVIGVIIGICTFIYPGITAVVLLYIIAFWGIVRGVGDLITAYLLRKDLKNVSELVIAGLVSLFFGVWLLVNPARGALAMLWLIGGYAIIFGVVMVVHALRLRRAVPEGLERRRA